jgi:hypothetical protein
MRFIPYCIFLIKKKLENLKDFFSLGIADIACVFT